MLAGVDLTGLRELAAACREASWEAMVSLTVSGRLAPDGTAVVACLPMLVGPARVVRPFRIAFDASRSPMPGTGSPAPVDGLLAAIGADAVATTAISLALQGANPTRICARTGLDAAGGIGCRLDISGELADGQAPTVAGHVRRFAVIPRTIAEPATVRLRVTGGGPVAGPGPNEDVASGRDAPFPARSVPVEWETGSYSVARAGGASLPVDQPKQLFGGDRGPGPQEYLLAAVAAEALSWLPRAGAQVHVSARLDLRGALGVTDGPVGLRDLLVQFLPPTDSAAVASPAVSAAGVPAELTAWARDGAVSRIVRRSQEIAVSVRDGQYADSSPAPSVIPGAGHPLSA
jgi:hypothetical protein